MSQWHPRDFITLALFVGLFGLKAFGVDGLVDGLLIAGTGAYLGWAVGTPQRPR